MPGKLHMLPPARCLLFSDPAFSYRKTLLPVTEAVLPGILLPHRHRCNRFSADSADMHRCQDQRFLSVPGSLSFYGSLSHPTHRSVNLRQKAVPGGRITHPPSENLPPENILYPDLSVPPQHRGLRPYRQRQRFPSVQTVLPVSRYSPLLRNLLRYARKGVLFVLSPAGQIWIRDF